MVKASLTTEHVYAAIMAKTDLTHHQVRLCREKPEYRLLLEEAKRNHADFASTAGFANPIPPRIEISADASVTETSASRCQENKSLNRAAAQAVF